MAIKFANLASTTLASGITSTATSLTVGDSSNFPSLGAGDYFYGSLGDNADSEIVKVTAISGSVFTITRGQDGTTAQAWSAGTIFALRVVAAALDDLAVAADTESVSKTGDTMTGNLEIHNGSPILELKDTTDNDDHHIYFKDQSDNVVYEIASQNATSGDALTFYSTSQEIVHRIGSTNRFEVFPGSVRVSDGELHVTKTGDTFPKIYFQRTGGTTKTNQAWQFTIGSTGNLNFVSQTGSTYYPIIMQPTGDIGLGYDTSGANPVLLIDQSLSKATFAGTITANGIAQSSFYALTLSRSSTGTTTPDIWGTNNTFVIGTSSSTEAVAFSGANATFYGNIASGAINITTAAVPLSFTESGYSGNGQYWRMPLDGGNLRFDVSLTGGSSFTTYDPILQLNSDGTIDVQSSQMFDASGNINTTKTISSGAITSGEITTTAPQFKYVSNTDANVGLLIRDETYVSNEADITATRLSSSGANLTLGLAGQAGINAYVSGSNVFSLNSSGNATFAGDLRVKNSGRLYLWNDHSLNYIQYNHWQGSASAGMTIKNIAGTGDLILGSGNATALTLDGSDQSATFVGNIVNDIGNSGNDSFIELKNTGYTGNVTSLRQNADSSRSELNSTERPIYIQAGSGGSSTGAEIRLYANQQLGYKLDANKDSTFYGKIKNGSYTRILTGASNTGQITFNADWDGSGYVPDYSGNAYAGMSVIKMPGGGYGGLEVYTKNSGTTSTSQALSTFTKVADFNDDGYFDASNGLRVGGSAFADTSRNITSGYITATSDTYSKLYSATNAASVGIRFSDNQTGSYGQYGDLRYYHADGASYGSGNTFVFQSSESTLTVLADGKLMFKEGLYLKPSSGTGAGTQLIDSAGNMSNIGTISSGAITSGTINVNPQGNSSSPEGGEIVLLGSGSNEDIKIDNYSGTFRIFDASTPQVRLTLDTSGNAVIGGTLSSGAITSTGNIITNNSSRIENGRISMEADGTLDWGNSKDYGTLSWSTGKVIIRGHSGKAIEFQTNQNNVALTLDTSQNAYFTGNVNAATQFIVNGSGNLLKVDVSSWGSNSDQVVLWNGWNSTLNDHVVLKASGNGTAHAAIIVADNVFSYGSTTSSVSTSASLTNPLSNSTAFTVTSGGNADFSGYVHADTNIEAGTNLGVANTSSTTKYGLALYGGASTNPTYGIMFTGTSGVGTHGSVTGNWATYFTMDNSDSRGWIFRNQTTGNVASIENTGNADFDGRVAAHAFVSPGSHATRGVVRVTNPGGADQYQTGSTITGALKITLPVSWTSTMMRMTIQVYEYANDESFTVYCGGYNYSSSSQWINTFAQIISSGNVSRDFTVRFGHDGSKCCIYIGELNSTWSYPQVTVTDFQGGYSNASEIYWSDGWDVGYESSAFGTVTRTESNTDIGIHHTNIKIGGTEVIDSSRNLTGISTGAFSGKLTISNASYGNHLELVRGSDTPLYLTPSAGQLITNGGFSADVTNQDDLGRTDKYWANLWLGTSLKMGGTTVIDANRYITSTGLNVSTSSPIIKIDDSDATNATNQVGYISFQRGGSEKAWIGYGSSGNDNFSIRNTEGAITLESSLETSNSIVASGGINLSNSNLSNVNALIFNDPGPGEGVSWNNGNGWNIYESPDNLTTNGAGNLQFVSGGSRRVTFDTDGNIELQGLINDYPLANAEWGMTLSSNLSVDITGNKISKSGNDNTWDANVRGTVGHKYGAYARLSPAGTSSKIMFGLNTDPDANASYTTIDYAFYLNSGNLQVYENGASRGSVGTYVAGDDLEVVFDNPYIRYIHNRKVVYTTTRTTNGVLYFDSSFYDTGTNQTQYIDFGPYHGDGREGRLIEKFNPTGHFYLGNNDWTSLIFGNVPNTAYEYSEANQGVTVDGNYWIKIPVRMPIDPDARYRVRVRVTKESGTGTFYVGTVPLNDSFSEISTDTATTYNYLVSGASPGTDSVYEKIASGYNPTAPTTGSALAFDPEAKYFNLVLICNYQGSGVTTIHSLEVERIAETLYAERLYGDISGDHGLQINIPGDYVNIASRYLRIDGKEAFDAEDTYLRINQDVTFGSGVWFGASKVWGSSNAEWGLGANGSTPANSRIYFKGGVYDGNNVITLDGSTGDITASDVILGTDKYVQPVYRKSITNVSSAGWVNVANIEGALLGSHVQCSFTGTANSVVVCVTADIYVNHSQDIYIKSSSTWYTALGIRVVSNGNEDFSIQIKTTSSNAAAIACEIRPLSNETVTFSGTTSYSTKELIHTTYPGETYSGTGGGYGNIKTDGDITLYNNQAGDSHTADIHMPRGGFLTFYGNSNNYHGIGSRNNSGSVSDDIRINSYHNVYVNLDSNDNNTSGGFYIGRHGAGTSGIDYLLSVNSENGDLVTEGNVTAYGSPSDIRLKESIETISDPISKVQQLRGVTFTYKKDGKRSTGLIAQELQKVLPEVVYTTEDLHTKEEHLAVRYGNTVGLLVEAIKEQQQQIETLKKEIEDLKNGDN